MGERIVVINPNSTRRVTEGIDRAVEPLRFADGPAIDCLTLAEGPPGIESQRHVDGVIGPLCRLVESHDNRASAFVIACFSDPGLQSARETTRKPVLGIAESGIATALTLGERFGIVAILASPAVPSACDEVWRRIGLEGSPSDQRLPDSVEWGRYAGGLPVEVGPPLFPRVDV